MREALVLLCGGRSSARAGGSEAHELRRHRQGGVRGGIMFWGARRDSKVVITQPTKARLSKRMNVPCCSESPRTRMAAGPSATKDRNGAPCRWLMTDPETIAVRTPVAD
jgi:hypothetical protein